MNGYQTSPSKSSQKSGSSSIDPDSFKKELNRASVSVETLQVHRKRIQSEADDINLKLKKNVFQNYSLFIDSAKEISLLKNEMYSLSKLLTDEQGLLSSLTDVSISGDRAHGLTLTEKKEVAAKFKTLGSDEPISPEVPLRTRTSTNPNAAAAKDLIKAIEKIDGGAGLLETRNRYLVHAGELTELDPNDYSRMVNDGKIFMILANDCLILSQSYAFRGNSSRGKKYKFVSMIELDNIATVNVKDVNYKSAFKVLMSSTTKVFETESIESKKKWLDKFDEAKKARRQSLSFQRRDSMLLGQIHELSPNKDGTSSHGYGSNSMMGHSTSAMSLRGSHHMSPVTERFPSFDEEMEDISESESEFVPTWLQEVPDDMDVLIAQRNFEDAVNLVHKVNDHITMYPKCFDGFFHNDLRLRINHKIQELVDCVSNELKVSPDRSLQSGPRSARRAVHLLLRLGKSVMATKLFLDQRTAILKFSLKNQMKEGATLQYIKKMSSVFFNNLIESCREFEKAFKTVNPGTDLNPSAGHQSSGGNSIGGHGSPNQGHNNADSMSMNGIKSPSASYPVAYPMSSLVKWSIQELNYFLNIFSKNVFTPQVPTSVSAECVSILRNHTNRVRNALGLDLLFVLDRSLKKDIERVIQESCEKLIEAVKLRVKDDRWDSQDFKNKPALNKFVDEMKETGLSNINDYIYDDYKVSLTSSVTLFAKSYLNLTSDVLKLSTPFTSNAVIDAIVKSFAAEMKYIEQVIKSLSKGSSNEQKIKFVKRNASFILDSVVTITEQLYQEKTGTICKHLEKEKQKFLHLPSLDETSTQSRRQSSDGGHGQRRGSNDHRRPSHPTNSGSSTPNSSRSSPMTANNGTNNGGNKRSPSKSTISIGTDGKTVSTTTYL